MKPPIGLLRAAHRKAYGTNPLLRAYTGSNAALVIDADGEASSVGNLSEKDYRQLGLNEAVDLSKKLKRVNIFADTEPSVNVPWWVSEDGGATIQRARAIDKTLRVGGTFWHVILEVSPDPSIPAPSPTPGPSPAVSGIIKVAFSFGDATPRAIAIAQPGQTLLTSQIIVTVPFNGITPSLTLGDAGQSDRFIAATQNDPGAIGEYETNPNYTFTSSTEILLATAPGEGCSQGSGFIVLEVK